MEEQETGNLLLSPQRDEELKLRLWDDLLISAAQGYTLEQWIVQGDPLKPATNGCMLENTLVQKDSYLQTESDNGWVECECNQSAMRCELYERWS